MCRENLMFAVFSTPGFKYLYFGMANLSYGCGVSCSFGSKVRIQRRVYNVPTMCPAIFNLPLSTLFSYCSPTPNML